MKKQIKITIEETIGKETTTKEFVVKKQHYTKKEIEEYSNELYGKEIKELFENLTTITEDTKQEKTLDDLIEFLESKGGSLYSGSKDLRIPQYIFIFCNYDYKFSNDKLQSTIGKVGNTIVQGNVFLWEEYKEKLKELKEFMGWE